MNPVNVKQATEHELMWVVILHLTLVFSGVMFALMDRIAGANSGHATAKQDAKNLPA